MNKEQNFNKLFKVNIINELLNLDDEEGTVTRGIQADHKRTLNFMRYAYEEGIKFGKEKDNSFVI